ncbi:MAG TPA: exopolyphosphatase [Acidiferrobacterales bacterium]|nr:exopolyphosphatase [Acidiferrobacterales bacterium]
MARKKTTRKSPAPRPLLGKLRARLRGTPSVVAAVDLGSNSFHLLVAQTGDGMLHVLDRLQEMVRLGGGLDENNRLTPAVRARALACLARFGQRLRGLPRGSVRAVGTNTLRRLRNGDAFLVAAERALGHPIEIIAGREEARLIYQGMAQSRPDDGRRRLVVDIGGGSTELIVGEGREPLVMESLHMGCVGLSQVHFADGVITAKGMRRAETAARLELQPVENQFRRSWEVAIGTSGTIRAIRGVLRAEGWTDGAITRAALARLRDALIAARHIDRIELNGLNPERAPVFPGGVAILSAVFEALGVERMQVADGALREGLLYDLLGRLKHSDVREQTVSALGARFRADAAQAERVALTAAYCFKQVARAWLLDAEAERMLGWAARLHELGLTVAHNQYHKHGGYLAEKADLPGFTWQEQQQLAALIRGHRRKFPLEVFELLPLAARPGALRLCVLLRLAVLLHRGRHDIDLKGLRIRVTKRIVQIRFARGWLRRHPLTQADLELEIQWLKTAGVRLEVV